ncbi:hypothetical protein VB836_19585 [Limnoraphis robusta BA-68 BA1]|nr:hypothetical protein [Limnoraphis robusta BA-68 BA1]
MIAQPLSPRQENPRSSPPPADRKNSLILRLRQVWTLGTVTRLIPYFKEVYR